MDRSFITVRQLKRLVPTQVRRGVKETLLKRKFRRAFLRIGELPEGQFPSRELLSELQVGWGNEGFAARSDYLEEVIRRAAETRGPILECGSGLTSLLLGLFAGRRGIKTWSLEHVPEWHQRMTAVLRQFRVPGADVRFSPLREYDGFSWYDAPLDMLPEKFSLVICDGPPGSTSGGRYGLLPVLGGRLPTDAVILLDDADREGESDVLQRWVAERNLRVALHDTPTGTFAIVTC